MLTLSKVTKKKTQLIWGNCYRKRKSHQESAVCFLYKEREFGSVCHLITRYRPQTNTCNTKGVVLSLNCDSSASFQTKCAYSKWFNLLILHSQVVTNGPHPSWDRICYTEKANGWKLQEDPCAARWPFIELTHHVSLAMLGSFPIYNMGFTELVRKNVWTLK